MNVIKLYIILLILLFSPKIYAQQVIQTSIRVDDIKKHFAEKTIQWSVPISHTEKVKLTWQEKETSFASDGIHSFVGYFNNTLTSTLSFSKNSFYGSILTDNGELIMTEENGFLKLISHSKDTFCNANHDNHSLLNRKNSDEKRFKTTKDTSTPAIENTSVLRIYRLAVLIDYSVYSGVHIENKNKALTVLSNIETFLNEVYVRDLGIKFEILKNDALIIDSEEKEVFSLNTLTNKRYENTRFIYYGTNELNRLIGEENYDLGVILTLSRNGGGLATLYGGYSKKQKGAATVNTPSLQIIAHEIGHLFGGRHTFSNSNTKVIGFQTEQTELGQGFSVMSYGAPRDFFSLSSIELIRNHLFNKPYYTDKSNKNNITGTYNADSNIPYAIEINNQAPKIDKSSIQPSYTIPTSTSFQFNIHATDADDDDLSYFAQQRDAVIHTGAGTPSKTRFFTKPGRKHNQIEFKPEYTTTGYLYTVTNFKDTGTATFWLSASDSKPITENQITKYDLVETHVNFVNGTPFKISSDIKKTYQTADKVTLTWDVDYNLFKDTYVRILMSDDFGETYKYTLVSKTENDGSCEVSLPPITLGKKTHYNRYGNPIAESGNGLFKIEVIDNIAFALSDYNPNNGGFTIENSKISFYDLPPNEITVNSTIPEADEVTAKTTCTDNRVSIQLNEVYEKNMVNRTWTATDNCNNTAIYNQKIHVLNKVNASNKNITIQTNNCQFELTKKQDLSISDIMTDDSSNPITSLKIKEINGSPISLNSLAGVKPKTGQNIIQWVALDRLGVETQHTQIIKIERGECYQPGIIGESLPSDVLISTLNRGDNLKTNKQNGILVLESKNKGLVLTIIPQGKSTDSIKSPIDGMIVFDENENCIKLYDGNQWSCIQQKAIPLK